MKGILFSLVLGLFSLWLAATTFSQTVILGPLLILVTLSSAGYSLYRLVTIKSKLGKAVLAFLVNLLSFPS